MLHIRTPLWALVLFAGSALLVPPANAQEAVQWRRDYNAARKEAKEKGLPLILDFGTPTCTYCIQLDQTTFRDPEVLKAMNEQFVPLKINALENKDLAEKLAISSFPTVILADAEGRILGTMVGFQDAPHFYESMQRALAQVANPEWMVRDYTEAGKAYNASDYSRAITLLRNVLDDGKTRPVQQKSRQLLTEIEKQAASRMARARQAMDKSQTTEAVTALTEVVSKYAGTQEATDARDTLTRLASSPVLREQQRTSRARELLAQAKEDYRTKEYLRCLDRCDILSASFGDLQEAVEGMQLAAEIKSNPEWMQSTCDNLTERLSGMYIALAETWLQKGQPKQAMVCLERVVRTFPGSRQAEVAQVRLLQLQGQPTRPVDFQKQGP